MFLISTLPIQYLFIARYLSFFTYKSPEIKINQILFCKVNLGIFGPLILLDCHVETQLTDLELKMLSNLTVFFSFNLACLLRNIYLGATCGDVFLI